MFEIPLIVALVAVAALLTMWLWLRLWSRRYGVPTSPDRVETVDTEDGWRLSMDVHLPEGPRRGVVVTCHGLGANRYNLDLTPGASVVEYLVERGFEVWNVDLRGNGNSLPAPGSTARRWWWSFDDHVRVDVPCILETVTARSGADRVHWVGHSMGGMVMYGHLGRCADDSRVASVTAAGSPALFEARGLVLVGAHLGSVLARLGLPIRPVLASRLVAPVMAPYRIDVFTGYGPNFDGETLRHLLWKLPSPMSPAMLRQFAGWSRDDDFESHDGEENYLEGLRNVRTPFLFFAGNRDRLAPPSAVRAAFDRVQSEHKELVILGRDAGQAIDYCHGALILGRTARDEVWPQIADWIERHEAADDAEDEAVVEALSVGAAE